MFLCTSISSFSDQILEKIIQYFENRHLKTLEENQSALLDKKLEHVNALTVCPDIACNEQRVKARISDITQLMVKYNLDSRYFNTSEIDNLSKTINVLLDVIQKLVELPLCKDCRYYTQEEALASCPVDVQRDRILKLIPPTYQSLFEKVEPRRMEDMSKPLDERRICCECDRLQ